MNEMTPISIEESSRLIALEGKINSGLKTFIEVGESLMEIRDLRLYRIEHSTFEDYCQGKWGMSVRQAQRLIGGATVVAAINETRPIGRIPTSESQTRPLTKLAPEKQVEAWGKAVKSADGKQPTAKQVEAAVVEVLPPETISPEEPAPSEAMALAEKAIKCLEKIKPEDPKYKDAIRQVKQWMQIKAFSV